jgi:hypothetical protein
MASTSEQRRVERIADIEGTGRLVNELIAEAKDNSDSDLADAASAASAATISAGLRSISPVPSTSRCVRIRCSS